MDFDREYDKTRRPESLEDFTDGIVQALVEGRRKVTVPLPGLILRQDLKPFEVVRRQTDWHYDSQGYCDNPGRGY